MWFKQKFSKQEQAQFFIKCAELLREGFSMEEALRFLIFIFPKRENALQYILQLLASGKRFDEALSKLGVHPNVISQIYLAQENGQFHTVLLNCGLALEKRSKQLNKIRQLLIYPSFLLTFVIVLLVGIRQFFLGQLEQLTQGYESNLLMQTTLFFIRELPLIGTVLIGGITLSYMILRLYYQHKRALERLVFLSHIPILSRWVSLYFSAYFAQELAYFYANGYTLNDIIHLLKQGNTSQLLQEFAMLVESNAKHGRTLSEVIQQLHFLREEMSYIVQYGEKISQLSTKLTIYAQDCFHRLEKDIEVKITLIQPIIFLFVGILILCVYLTLMLPMLSMVDSLFI